MAEVTQLTLKVPFQIGDTGGIDTITDPVVLAAQEIKTILLTMVGERSFNPQVGSPFSSHLFSAMASDDQEYYTESMLSTLTNQATLSTIQAATFTPNANDGSLTFQIEYVANGYFQNTTTTVTLT